MQTPPPSDPAAPALPPPSAGEAIPAETLTDPLSEATAPATAAPLRPVAEAERIGAIDVARGFALLGIFLVNVQFFAEPFGRIMEMAPPAGARPLDVAAFYFVAIFCSGKFYPLFSTLFGIGFVIQFDRARRAGRAFAPSYLRRLAFLCALGLVHGVLLWYGDILFLYSIAGTILFIVLLVAPDAAPRTLASIGAGLIVFSILLIVGINAVVMAVSGPDPGGEAPATMPADADAGGASGGDNAVAGQGAGDAEAGPGTVSATQATTAATAESEPEAGEAPAAGLLIEQLFAAPVEGPNDPRWMALETRAYREGPYLEALAFRAMTFAFALVFALAGFGWHVLGMFFIGAALMRAGAFEPANLRLHRRLALLGLFIGLPLVALAAITPGRTDSHIADIAAAALSMVGGPLVALAYLAVATLIVAHGIAPAVTRVIARAGRMALSNYLAETLITTFIMYHWGLGLFGTFSRAAQIGLVVAIYLSLLILSTLWMRVFVMGPMEWLWRCVTYLRLQPLVRRPASGAD